MADCTAAGATNTRPSSNEIPPNTAKAPTITVMALPNMMVRFLAWFRQGFQGQFPNL